MGGSSVAAALRAAKVADAFLPTISSLWQTYREACEVAGRDPGPAPLRRGPSFVYVTDHPERAWSQIAPHAIHERQLLREMAR